MFVKNVIAGNVHCLSTQVSHAILVSNISHKTSFPNDDINEHSPLINNDISSLPISVVPPSCALTASFAKDSMKTFDAAADAWRFFK